MKSLLQSFPLSGPDGYALACYSWIPESVSAVIHIAHGMGEHAQRYDWLAGAFNAAGYAVFAQDHRGHGLSSASNLGSMGEDGWNRHAIAKIPQDLPIYIVSGAEDPVHGKQKDLQRMMQAYRKHGINNLASKLYPGGRHEMFNEVNRDEVVKDLLGWLKAQVLEPGT